MDSGLPSFSPMLGEGAIEEMIEVAVEAAVLVGLTQNFGQMRGFESETGRLDFFRMFDWLAGIEQGAGQVDETTMSEEGRSWLLSKLLGETLLDAIASIADTTVTGNALSILRNASQKRSAVMSENLNQANEYYGIFSEDDRTEEMTGNHRR